MKTQITLITILFLSILTALSQEEQQEVLIVGTMHTVPKIVKHSYKPLLRFTKKYNPEAIYVESPMANDTISWKYLKNGWSKNYQLFLKRSDSIRNVIQIDEKKFNILSAMNYADLSSREIDYLINSYLFKRDNGNYELLSYLKEYGVNGVKKPTRHEDDDLTYKLALSKNLKVINMDDQQTNGEYHIAWKKCVREGIANGNNIINKKLNKKDYNSAIFPAIFRRLGRHVNKRKSLNRLNMLSSFSYVKVDTEGCKEARKYWNERDMRMAKNIGLQVEKSGKKRNIVIVGASHVIGLEKELKKNYPNIKVVLMNEY